MHMQDILPAWLFPQINPEVRTDHNQIVSEHKMPCTFPVQGISMLSHSSVLAAASTTWPTSIEVVTLPTPPGTGVMAATTGSTAA